MGIKQKIERFVQDHFHNDFVCEPPIMEKTNFDAEK